MTKFEAIIIALSITPFPHEVWSLASSAAPGLNSRPPYSKLRALTPRLCTIGGHIIVISCSSRGERSLLSQCPIGIDHPTEKSITRCDKVGTTTPPGVPCIINNSSKTFVQRHVQDCPCPESVLPNKFQWQRQQHYS